MNTLVLFDIDKTLLESNKKTPVHAKAFSYGIQQAYGIKTEFTYKKIHEIAGMTDQQIIKFLLVPYNIDKQEIKEKMLKCTRKMSEYYQENIKKEDINALPGAKKLLEELQGRAMLGIVTGNIEPIGWKKLKAAGLREYFTLGAFGSDAEERHKLVEIAIKKAKEKGFQGNKIFLLGDTVRDVQAGNKNQVKVIAVATGSTTKKQLEEAGAYRTFETLEKSDEIIEIIKN